MKLFKVAFLIFTFAGLLVTPNANSSTTSELKLERPIIQTRADDQLRNLNEREEKFIQGNLAPSLRNAIHRVSQYFTDNEFQDLTYPMSGPNCFWLAHAYHSPALREKPIALNYSIRSLRVTQDLEDREFDYDISEFDFGSTKIEKAEENESMASSIRINIDDYQTNYRRVEESKLKKGDLMVIRSRSVSYDGLPGPIYNFLIDQAENNVPPVDLPFRFYHTSESLVHIAVYLGEGMVFQKDNYHEPYFTLMGIEQAKRRWKNFYQPATEGSKDPEFDNLFQIEFRRPTTQLLNQLNEIIVENFK